MLRSCGLLRWQHLLGQPVLPCRHSTLARQRLQLSETWYVTSPCTAPARRVSGCPTARHRLLTRCSGAVRQQGPSADASSARKGSTATKAVLRTPIIADAGGSGSSSSDEFRFRVAPVDLTGSAKLRLDAYLAAKLPDASRAKIQSGVKTGLVTVNGKPLTKCSHGVRAGDAVAGSLPPPAVMQAVPEALPLDIVHEDAQLLVINKAAGMVVHLGPGHYTGTLVNGLLHHCGLSAIVVNEGAADVTTLLPAAAAGLYGIDDDDDDGDLVSDEDEATGLAMQQAPDLKLLQPAALAPAVASPGTMTVIRPGIVHRLDKGTTGLLVVAKDERTHRHLSEQFKARTVSRTYHAIVLGCPQQPSGTVETNIVRDPGNRKRMATAGFRSSRGRYAISNYRLLEPLVGGAAALVEWRLQTGRTHQIRVHAKHLGHPLIGDDTYGCSSLSAAKALAAKRPSTQMSLKQLLQDFDRPALHALTLGFTHPATGERMQFASQPAPDFERVLQGLRHFP